MTNQQPSQGPIVSIENNFTKGLLTEFTGLNFPENAATDTANCIYTLTGDVIRREGFDYEVNHGQTLANRGNQAISYYTWTNVGGDGLTQVVVQQIGFILYFWRSSTASISNPLSTQLIGTVEVDLFAPAGVAFDITHECQFADGNGYLFVYHPTMDPIYITYNNGTLTATTIIVQIRDFVGVLDNLPVNTRPSSLSNEHLYNLINQGWTQGNPWQALSSTLINAMVGPATFSIPSGLSINNGDYVRIYNNHEAFPGDLPIVPGGTTIMSGSVTSYSGTNLTINVNYYGGQFGTGTGLSSYNDWGLVPINHGYINTWLTDEGNYPSNADVWWYFKDSTGIFNPATTQINVSIGNAYAPKGHFIYNAFQQQRGLVSGISGLTDTITNARPKTGCWFQGRVWYTGVDAQQPTTGDVAYSTWTENIYFSQIVQTVADFSKCYESNDPTSEELFDLLSSDGGVIQIQGAGSIYKLFPLLNALLVFAANGIWYISGGSSVGFSATDYTIVKLSAVKSLSSTSFVDVNGLPMFWNEEGIYQVEPAKQGTQLLNSPLHVQPLEVNPLTVGTILTYYNNIPLQSKKYVKGAYSPIDYVVQWCFKSMNETGITDRYTYDTILNFNTYNKAFYPYTFDISSSITPSINGIIYVSSPGGSTAPNSVFKYGMSVLSGSTYIITFGDEHDDTFTDWVTQGTPTDYTSYFVTGYKVHGQGQRRFQVPFIDVFLRNTDVSTSYEIQSIWDFATSSNSGRWSIRQIINNWNPNYGMSYKRHRLRGRGIVLQIKVTSVTQQPFDIMGWSAYEIQNPGV